MQDDFDNRMGLPDDELPGGSAMSDMGESAEHAETDMDHVGSEPAGRPSGGARARKSTAGPKRSDAPKAVSAPAPVVRKSAGRKAVKKKSAPRKAVKKAVKKAAGKKKGAKKAVKKAAGKKKKGGRRR